MAEKNFVRLDKVSNATHYETVISNDTPLINGTLVNLGAVIEGHREAVDFEVAEEGKGFDALIATEYLGYGALNFDILTQETPAGKPGRAIIVENGAIISINEELAKGLNKKDNVTVGAKGIGFRKAEPGTDVVVGKVIDTEYLTNVGNIVSIRITK